VLVTLPALIWGRSASGGQADLEEQAAWLTFVVVGGGPTGVEMAGQIGELARETKAKRSLGRTGVTPTLSATVAAMDGESVTVVARGRCTGTHPDTHDSSGRLA
jgi:hypothetical protein